MMIDVQRRCENTPRKGDSAKTGFSKSEQDRSSGGAAKGIVLVVEDDALNMLSFRTYLDLNGYEVLTAVNGRQALDVLEANHVDAVVMDIQMPVMNGLDATRAIRASKTLGTRARVPIVAVTAYAMPEDRTRFMDAGMDDFLAKPVDLDQLVKTVERLCPDASDGGPSMAH